MPCFLNKKNCQHNWETKALPADQLLSARLVSAWPALLCKSSTCPRFPGVTLNPVLAGSQMMTISSYRPKLRTLLAQKLFSRSQFNTGSITIRNSTADFRKKLLNLIIQIKFVLSTIFRENLSLISRYNSVKNSYISLSLPRA